MGNLRGEIWGGGELGDLWRRCGGGRGRKLGHMGGIWGERGGLWGKIGAPGGDLGVNWSLLSDLG